MLKRSLLFLLFSILVVPGRPAWPQGEGGGYFNLSFTYLKYHELISDVDLENGFQHHGLKRAVSDHTLNAYMEYGVSDRFTALADVPYKFLSTGNELMKAPHDPYPEDTVEAGRLQALGNVRLGGRYLLSRGDFLWSAQLMLGMKSASYHNATGLRSGYDAWYATPRIQVGKGWGKTYFKASLGYRYKTNGYANDLISDNEFGYKWQRGAEKATWFIFTMGAQIPLSAGKYSDRNSIHTGTYRNGEGFVDPGLKINHDISKGLTLNIAAIGAIWARYGGNNMTYTAGLAYDW